ncbi:MAG: class I SAM-dependent methyltransferase [Candidatus Puniceispirillaceae bacterium]
MMFATLRYRIAKNIILKLARRIGVGELHLTFPEGDSHHFKGSKDGPTAQLSIIEPVGLNRIIKDGKMGFCEAYMANQVASNNLVDLVEFAVLNNAYIEEKLQMNKLSWALTKLRHNRNRNSKKGSKRNISYHYDLGNDFYAEWLDETMTYSSAVFDKHTDNLSKAQEEKYRRLAEMADLKAGDKVLEIGCGWGGFVEFAAREYDVHVTGITISQEQFDFANQRIKNAGITDKASIIMTDYRDLESASFDKVVSIEMFEAVGMAYWPAYFDKVADVLKKGGKAALQVITIDDKEFDSYVATPDFIQKYIFPGGMLPSMERIKAPIENAGMALVEAKGYGLDYAKTLEIWREKFLGKWPTIQQNQGFDNQFKNMWELYLAYCEGGFKTGMIDVKQMLLTRD